MASPLPVAFLNGRFLPASEARISAFDRGFLFADSVYESIPVFSGHVFLLEPHLERLDRSLSALAIQNPYPGTRWQAIVDTLVRRNGGGTMAVYIQVTRGADRGRDHRFPGSGVQPTVFGMCSAVPDPHPDQAGIAAITYPDLRWARCDIKSTGLLANVLAREAAQQAGAGEAILLRDGMVTEGSASSVLIVERGTLRRRGAGHDVLAGTTTDVVVGLAREAAVPVRPSSITEAQLRVADEIWITAASRGMVPVTRLDGAPVGTGEPGPVWRRVAPLFETLKRGQRRQPT